MPITASNREAHGVSAGLVIFFFFLKKKKLKATHPDLVQLVSPEQTYTSMGVAFDAKERYNYPVRILSLSLMFSGSICAGLKQS